MALFSERTEAPTPKRREEARRRGQLPKSGEVTAVAVMAAGFTLVYLTYSRAFAFTSDNVSFFLTSALSAQREELATSLGSRSVSMAAGLLLPALAVAAITALAANALQSGAVFTAQPISPDFSRISPSAGVQRLFSSIALGELVKSFFKLSLVAWVVYSVLRGQWSNVLMTSQSALEEGLTSAMGISRMLITRVLLALAAVAVADFALQRYRYESRLRLTRQEMKEETRQTEGDPLLRSRIRKRQRQIAMQRMMQQVPHADVVVTNPTHFAVAIRYDAKTMHAPKVLAKGVDFIAHRIIATARQHGVSVVQNPPLAQALHKSVEIGQFIPRPFYQAVAEVLAYVYRLTGRTLQDSESHDLQ